MRSTTKVGWTAAILIHWPLSGFAGSCDAYFTFDGTLADASGNGYDGEMIVAKGEPSEPQYTDGKFGQALMLDGNAAMRALLDLHYDACPKVTVSAWIQVSRNAPDDTMHLFSTGGGSGPGLTVSGSFLTLKGTENGIGQQNAIRKGSWIFVVGVYDYTAGKYTLHWGGRSATQKLSEHRYEPQDAFWLGTVHDDWGIYSRGIAVDDLRITGHALDAEEVMALRARPAGSTAVTAIRDEPFAPAQLPGDQYEPTQLPGDHFEPTQLPGDHFEPTQLPGDQYEPTQLPGDQYGHTQLPGDQYEPSQQPDVVDRNDDSMARPEVVSDIPEPDVGDQYDATQQPDVVDRNDDSMARTKDYVDVPEPDVDQADPSQ